MLNGFPVMRFASNHSPERESREALFARSGAGAPRPGATPEATTEAMDPVRQELLQLRDETRTKIDSLLQGIVTLKQVEGHTMTETPLFSLSKILDEKKAGVMNLLNQELVSPANANVDSVRRKVQMDIDALQQFHNHASSLEHHEELNEDEWKAKGFDGVGSGVYSSGDKKVFLKKGLSESERISILEHERGHGLFHALEMLAPELIKKVYGDPKQEAALNAHLKKLKDDAAYTGKNADEVIADRYYGKRYGERSEALTAKAGQHEEAVFELLERRPGMSKENSDDTFITNLEEHDPTGIVARLAAIGAAKGPAHEQYGLWQGDTRLLLLKMMKRHEKWASREYRADFAGQFSGEEEKIMQEVDGLLKKHVQNRVQQELQSVRKEAADARAFDSLISSLSKGGSASDKYAPYAGDTALILKELVNRHADFRAGRDARTFTDVNELAIFCQWDPLTRDTLEPGLRAKVDARIEAAGGTVTQLSDEAAPADGKGESLYSVRTDHHDEHAEEHEEGHGHEQEEESTPSPEKLLHDIHKVRDHISEMVSLNEETVSRLRSMSADEETLKGWEANTEYLAKGLMVTDLWTRATTLVAQWKKKPRITPEELLKRAPTEFNLDGEDQQKFVLAVRGAAPGGKWIENDEDPNIKGLDHLLNSVIDQIEGQRKNLEEELSKTHDAIQEIEENAQIASSGGKGWTIKFYSINHLVAAVQHVWHSYTKAWSQWGTLRESEIANGVGDMLTGLPFGKQAKVSLEMELDHKNDEIKDEFKKHLEHDLATFDHCCMSGHGHASLLEQNAKDPNKFRGVLEYMAGKGWLYDLNALRGSAFNVTILDKLPPTWLKERKEQYVRDLEQQNSSGEDSAKKSGKSRVDTYPDIPPMMVVLEDELKRRNYWAIFGIVERAIDKGKKGETSAWLCTVIMRYLQEDPVARKYFPKSLMDQLGNIGIVSPVWLTTFFKLDRHDLVAYQRDRKKFNEAGTLAHIVSDIKNDIQHAQQEAGLPFITNNQMLDQLVAKVMASQTVREHDWKHAISIYQKKYDFYRKKISTTKTSIKPGDADDDFYNAYSNDGSEVQLLGADGFQTICLSNTTGDLIQDTKAKYFLEQLIHRFDDLEKHEMTNELETFLDETQEKMKIVVVGTWTHGLNNKLMEINFRSDNSRKLILELMSRNIITKDSIKEANEKGSTFAPAAWKAANKAGLAGYDDLPPAKAK